MAPEVDTTNRFYICAYICEVLGFAAADLKKKQQIRMLVLYIRKKAVRWTRFTNNVGHKSSLWAHGNGCDESHEFHEQYQFSRSLMRQAGGKKKG